MKKVLSKFSLQKTALACSYWLCSFFVKNKSNLWVVGVTENASLLWNVGKILNPSITVNLGHNKYYNYNYTFINFKRATFFSEYLWGPILLGFLMNKSNKFFYSGQEGFLKHSVDGRKYELSFLKKKSKYIVCYFCGNDIRSPKLALKQAQDLGVEVPASYYDQVAPKRLTEKYENQKKQIAESADQFADIIFNAPVDQISYLKRTVHPFFYIYPDDKFVRCDEKFKNLSNIKIVHAPSSPIVKGTPLVRAAIKKLELEGYDFEYIELIGVPNTKVLATLRDAHIVLNEFYAFVPGVFGIEAMASHCALLTSGDPSIEVLLGSDAKEAWKITKYWEVYDNLKQMLDKPESIKFYADNGFSWSKKTASYTANKHMLNKLLNFEEN